MCFPRHCLEFNRDLRRQVLYFVRSCVPSPRSLFRSHSDTGQVLLSTSEALTFPCSPGAQREQSQISRSYSKIFTWSRDHQTHVPHCSGAKDGLGRGKADNSCRCLQWQDKVGPCPMGWDQVKAPPQSQPAPQGVLFPCTAEEPSCGS